MNAELKSLVDTAKAAGACSLVNEVEKFETVEEALASAKGPMLATWYATMVLKARWLRAETAIRRNNDCWSMYCTRLGIKE
jgi:hypothetical protein